MIIRLATIEDAYAIRNVHVSAYKTSYRGFLPDDVLDAMYVDDEEAINKMKKYLAETECHVVEENGTIIAFAYVSYPKTDIFEINAIYVHPQYQRAGAGSLLMDKICEEKICKKYNKCVVWTMKNGPSLPFYYKKGFIITSEEKMWKYDIPIIMLEKEL